MLLQVIDDAARRGDDDVDAVLEHLALLVVIHTAIDEGRSQSGMSANSLEVLLDLDRQFTRRRENHCARIAGLALDQGRFGQQAIKHRDEEGGGLARAGLCLAGDIAALKRDRQGQCLDRRAANEAGVVEAGQQARMQIETFKDDIGKRLRM